MIQILSPKENPFKGIEPHEFKFKLKDPHSSKRPKAYHWCPHNCMVAIHMKDKCEKDSKMAKLDRVCKEEMQVGNVNKAYHAFLCALGKEEPDGCFFSGENDRGRDKRM